MLEYLYLCYQWKPVLGAHGNYRLTSGHGMCLAGLGPFLGGYFGRPPLEFSGNLWGGRGTDDFCEGAIAQTACVLRRLFRAHLLD